MQSIAFRAPGKTLTGYRHDLQVGRRGQIVPARIRRLAVQFVGLVGFLWLVAAFMWRLG